MYASDMCFFPAFHLKLTNYQEKPNITYNSTSRRGKNKTNLILLYSNIQPI
jgi:hypothetical protein